MSERESRATDAPYGPDESKAILADLHAGRPLVCPRCRGPLQKGEPASPSSSLFAVFIVRCPTCRRAVFSGAYLPKPGSDVSGRAPQRRTKSRRREDTERERLFTMSLDMLCVCGFDAIFRQINPAFERVLGYAAPELTSQPFIEFVLEEDRERSTEAFRRCRAGGTVVTFENRFRHADGSSRWLQWNAVGDPEGQVIYATARDITDRKRADAELARLASIVESSNDAIIGMSLGGVIETWNLAAEEIFGYRGAEMQDKPMSLLIPPGHADHLRQHLDQMRRGQKVTHYETIRRRQDGSIISVSLTLSPVRDATGEVIGASLIARDITERKQAEKERMELLQQLQHALSRSKRLTGRLHYCVECKRVRSETGRWIDVERYIEDYSDASPIPGRCPDHAPPEPEA